MTKNSSSASFPAEPDIIIGVDPGGTTGLAWWIRKTGMIETKQIPNCDDDFQLLTVIHLASSIAGLAVPYVRPNQVHVVCEKFEFRLDERDRTKIDYTAAEVIGALRLWQLERDAVKLVMQGATKAKGFWMDDKLKSLGVWVPGARHAMDALRHLLAYRLFDLQHKELLSSFAPPPPATLWG